MTEANYPPQSTQAIGRRLRVTRDALGLTSRQMAEICGVEEKTLSAYITGQNLIKPDVAARIIQKFPNERIDFNWLYQGNTGGMSHGFAIKVEAIMSEIMSVRTA